MKKIVLLICVLLLSLSLCSCGMLENMQAYKNAEELYAAGDLESAAAVYESVGEYKDSAEKAKVCRYEMAKAAFESEDFTEALGLFEELSGHKDSTEMAEKCRREIGMRENADHAFLTDLETVVVNYLENFYEIVWERVYEAMEEELDLLEKYENETFYDESLHELALMYIEGTETFQAKVSASFWGDQQARNLKGIAMRYGVLTKLYHEYGFMEGNDKFLEFVVYQNDKYQRAYAGFTAVRNDLMNQLENADYDNMMDESTATLSFTITNNTEYSYSAILLLHLMDVRNVPLQTSDVVGIKYLQPGESCDIVLKDVENAERFWSINYNSIIALVDDLDVGYSEVYMSDPQDESWTGWYPDLILME